MAAKKITPKTTAKAKTPVKAKVTATTTKAKKPTVAIAGDTKSTKISDVLSQITASVALGANNKPRVFKDAGFPIGKTFPQGDVILTRISGEEFGKLKIAGPAESRQLAPGNSMGSRHIVTPGPKILTLQGATPLEGPVIQAETAFSVEHPKHRHAGLPAGFYKVTFPRDFAREELARRRD